MSQQVPPTAAPEVQISVEDIRTSDPVPFTSIIPDENLLQVIPAPPPGATRQLYQYRSSGLPELDKAFARLPYMTLTGDNSDRVQKEFTFRDGSDALLFKAQVEIKNQTKTVTLKSMTGRILLVIDCGVKNAESRVFKVCHQEVEIGSLAIKGRALDTVSICNQHENKSYVISSISGMQLEINDADPAAAGKGAIAKIHLHGKRPAVESNRTRAWRSFHGSIDFCNGLDITTVEQCLFVGLAMALMVVSKENDQRERMVASSVAFIIIFITAAAILILIFRNSVF